MAQAFVYGDSLQAFLVAVIVPDPEVVNKFAESNGIKVSYNEKIKITRTERFEVTVQWPNHSSSHSARSFCCWQRSKGSHGNVNEVWRKKLFGFEIVKKIHLEPEPWSLDNGILTPTFKLKRAECIKKYMSVINAMYAEGEGSSAL